MDLLTAIEKRHSVRSYTDQPIEGEVLAKLKEEIIRCNDESGLRIQLVTNEPDAFNGILAHYGKFTGVRNYIVLVGKKGDKLQETAGYFGERVALFAQSLGLNTCWVALTYSKIKGA